VHERRARDERGSALVELALVLPLVLMLVFGIIEFSATYNNVRNGTREGARMAVVDDVSADSACSAGAMAIVCKTKERIGLDTSKTKVGIRLDGTSVGDTVTICATYPAFNITGIMAPFLGGKTVSSSVTMRLEQTPTFGNYTGDGLT
jgi:hypothetical protein